MCHLPQEEEGWRELKVSAPHTGTLVRSALNMAHADPATSLPWPLGTRTASQEGPKNTSLLCSGPIPTSGAGPSHKPESHHQLLQGRDSSIWNNVHVFTPRAPPHEESPSAHLHNHLLRPRGENCMPTSQNENCLPEGSRHLSKDPQEWAPLGLQTCPSLCPPVWAPDVQDCGTRRRLSWGFGPNKGYL